MSMSITTAIEQRPSAEIQIRQLFILLHGVGGHPEDLEAMGQAFRQAFPASIVLIPAGLEPIDGAGRGRQWFSVHGITDADRPQRVAAAMPALVTYIRQQQQRLGLLQSDTALAGFSQGAIMALEIAQAHDGLVGRVMAFSGRYAQLPKTPLRYTTIHLLHGAADTVMPVALVQAAQAHLHALHGDATLDIASSVGHALHPALIQQAIVRLKTCVPLRSWEAALGLNQSPPDGSTVH